MNLLTFAGDYPEVASILTATVTAYFAYAATQRRYHAELFAAAYHDAMLWPEMFFRVRRRVPGEVAEDALIDRFHELQEKLHYQQGLMTTQSVWVGRSYERLLLVIKETYETLIRDAWSSSAFATKRWQRLPETAEEAEARATVEEEAKRFARDVRLFLSPFLFPRLFLVSRHLIIRWIKPPSHKKGRRHAR